MLNEFCDFFYLAARCRLKIKPQHNPHYWIKFGPTQHTTHTVYHPYTPLIIWTICWSETHDVAVLMRLLFPHPARWALHVNCAGSTALIEGLLLPLHLVSSASLLSHTDTQCSCSLTVVCTHTQLEKISHQYGRGQAILWEVTLQMSRQLQGQRTYFFPAGAFLMGCRGRQRHTGGRDKKTVEQCIRMGVDNKSIILHGQELTNTMWGREVFWVILEGTVLQSQVRNKGTAVMIHHDTVAAFCQFSSVQELLVAAEKHNRHN